MPLPLAGIKVLDFSRVLAGPFCTQLLGDMGADVIKVEEPGVGDETRSWAPFWNGESCFFMSVNRNKRGITVNLKDPRGIAICRRLAEQSDVLVENFRTGTAERMGLGYAELSQRNPRLIYCSISGFGRTGPSAHKPGYDLIMQGQGGLMSVTGEPDGPPLRAGYSLVDLTCGMLAYGGIVTALYNRERTGRGEWVESSLFEGQVAAMSYHATNYLATGRIPGRMGTGHPNIAPYQAFEAADGWMIIGVANDGLWRRFCDALGFAELKDDPRFRTNNDRTANRAELAAILQAIFRTKPKAAWLEPLEAAGVPCGPINNVAEVLSDPQVAAREMLVHIPHPKVPDLRAPGVPIKLDALRAADHIRRPPPLLGEHTAEVLAELGYSPAEIEKLAREKVI
jgi:crotonobetainyl-CoA:carnitine CoA-transferase CaiB-like acyl-CoA transferase